MNGITNGENLLSETRAKMGFESCLEQIKNLPFGWLAGIAQARAFQTRRRR